jgi:hypothetical protein
MSLTLRIWTPPFLQGNPSLNGVEDRLQSYIRPGWRTCLRAFMESAYRVPIVQAALFSQ